MVLIGLLACGGGGNLVGDGTPVDTGIDGDSDTASTPSEDTGSLVETGSPGDTGFSSPLMGQVFRFKPNSVLIPGFYDYFGPRYPVFLLEITGATPTTLDVRVGSFSSPFGGSQDLCAPTIEALGVDFSTDPELRLGPFDGIMMLDGLPVGVEQATSQLRFNATYDAITHATFEGTVDTRSLSNNYVGKPNYICDLVADYYTGCTVCPSSGTNDCIELSTTGGEARGLPGFSLVARTEADILADPACP